VSQKSSPLKNFAYVFTCGRHQQAKIYPVVLLLLNYTSHDS